MFYYVKRGKYVIYADDSTPFSSELNHKSVVEQLKNFFCSIIYMVINCMSTNTEKRNLAVIS